jgi:hypothetical protein
MLVFIPCKIHIIICNLRCDKIAVFTQDLVMYPPSITHTKKAWNVTVSTNWWNSFSGFITMVPQRREGNMAPLNYPRKKAWNVID